MALDTGQVVINGTGQHRAEVAPFRGFKQSGIGREGLSTSLLELVQNKNIVLRGLVSSDVRRAGFMVLALSSACSQERVWYGQCR